MKIRDFRELEAIFYILLILAFGLWIHSAEAEVPIVPAPSMPPMPVFNAAPVAPASVAAPVASAPVTVTPEPIVTTSKGYIGSVPINIETIEAVDGTATTKGWIDGSYIRIETKKD